MRDRSILGVCVTLVALAAPGSAQQPTPPAAPTVWPQFEPLGFGALPLSTAPARAAAMADVDGDGDLDLIVGNGGGEQNRLYLGDGSGSYRDATAAAMPMAADDTRGVAVGDVDGDGDLDLVFANAGEQDRLYANDGRGGFSDATASALPADSADSVGVVLADVDGDGDLDLAFADGAGEQSRLYVNAGNGVFTDVTTAQLPVEHQDTTSIVAGDVDGDGDVDLLMGSAGQPVQLWLDDGAGTFTDATAAQMPAASQFTQALALADVDGDGDLDLVLAVNGQNTDYLNDGTGTFADAGAVTPTMPVRLDDTTALALTDIDGDGDLDVLFGNRTGVVMPGQTRLYANDGSGMFTDVTATQVPALVASASSLAVGDVDGDGDPDVFVGHELQADRLYVNDGRGVLRDATGVRFPADDDVTRAVAAGDVDGDGDLDLVLANDQQPSRLYRNDGRGRFADVSFGHLPAVSESTHAVALGDVDGDGDLDIVLGNAARSQNRLLLNDGSGTFSDATAQLPVDQDVTYAVALGDVDGDGDLDLICGNWFVQLAAPPQNRLYLNDGTGHFTDVTVTAMPAFLDSTDAVALGDIDGDGDLDIAFGNYRQSRLLVNDGGGTFADVTATQLPAALYETNDLAFADVDGDGDLDLVLADNRVFTSFSRQNRLYRNDGQGRFADVTATAMPIDADHSTAVAVGDVDGDGDPDLVFANGEQNRLYLDDGTGVYSDATELRMPARIDDSLGVTLADLDGDGDLDLVVANDHRNTLDLDLLTQLEVPPLVRLGQPFELRAWSRYAYPGPRVVAQPLLSTATASIPLPPFGTLGIDPTRAVVLPAIEVPQPMGVGSTRIRLPNAPALVGAPIHAQALVIAGTHGARLTNVTTAVVIR